MSETQWQELTAGSGGKHARYASKNVGSDDEDIKAEGSKGANVDQVEGIDEVKH